METFIDRIRSELKDREYNMFYTEKCRCKGNKKYNFFDDEITPHIEAMCCDDDYLDDLYIGFKLEESPKYVLAYCIKECMLRHISQDVYIELVKVYYNEITNRINKFGYKMNIHHIIDVFSLTIVVPTDTLDAIVQKVISKYGLCKTGNIITYRHTLENFCGIGIMNIILSKIRRMLWRHL